MYKKPIRRKKKNWEVNTLETIKIGWYRGMDQQAGRQIGGNCWSWTEKRWTKINGNRIRDHGDSIKSTNICIMKGPRRRQEKGKEKVFANIIAENFMNLGKEIQIPIQEAKRVPRRINPKWTTSRLVKL